MGNKGSEVMYVVFYVVCLLCDVMIEDEEDEG